MVRKYNILKNLSYITITIFLVLFLASCAAKKPGYRPSKSKKKDCDCSDWTHKSHLNQTIHFS